MLDRVCIVCGTEFKATKKHVDQGWGKCCSLVCRGISTRKTEDDFWARILPANHKGCMIWTGRTNNKGYGLVCWMNKTTLVHRLAYTLRVGEISEGKNILHSCDTPLCCNYEHLREGTQADNVNDMWSRRRSHKGSMHYMAKLAEGDIPTIYARRKHGESLKEIASDYGVSEATISMIIKGKTWKHVRREEDE